jgi:hypothetical protein
MSYEESERRAQEAESLWRPPTPKPSSLKAPKSQTASEPAQKLKLAEQTDTPDFDTLLASLSIRSPKITAPEQEEKEDEVRSGRVKKEQKRPASRSTRSNNKSGTTGRAKYTLDDYLVESKSLKMCGRTLQGQVRLPDGSTKCVFLARNGANEETVQKLLNAAEESRKSITVSQRKSSIKAEKEKDPKGSLQKSTKGKITKPKDEFEDLFD